VAKKFKDSKIQEFKNSKIQEFKDSKTQGFKKVFCGFQCSDSYRNRYRAWWSRLRSKVWWSRSDSYRNRSRVWWSRLRSTTSNKIQNSIPWLSVFPRFSGNLIQSFVSRSLSGSWPLIHKFKDSKIQGFKNSRIQGFKKVFCGFQCSDSYRNRYMVWWSRLRSTTSNKIQNSIPWLSVFPRFSGNLTQSFVHSWLYILT
jgi:hypothetical protein